MIFLDNEEAFDVFEVDDTTKAKVQKEITTTEPLGFVSSQRIAEWRCRVSFATTYITLRSLPVVSLCERNAKPQRYPQTHAASFFLSFFPPSISKVLRRNGSLWLHRCQMEG